MPQLEFSTWIGQIFWLLVIFVTMYVVMTTFVVPRMQSIVSRREQKISGDLKRAEELKAEAESILEQCKEQLEEAKVEAEEIIANAKSKALEAHKKELDEFNEKNNKSTEIALEKIKTAKENAVKDIDSLAISISNEALNKVVGVKVDEKEIAKAIKLVK
ncbi:MAG: hypothetical protein ACPG8V_01440 [Alphaproteobacteria bacterium]